MGVQIIHGDAMAVLQTMPEQSVNCCVTSPPYWGLRDYGTAKWEGGEAGCEHKCGGQVQDNKAPGAISLGVRPGCDASVCAKCGAKRIDAQLGLEKTPEEYVSKMVEVFREVRRVLRDDGTLWLNLGDSYNGSGKGTGRDGLQSADLSQKQSSNKGSLVDIPTKIKSCKPKDLIGIPWLVALALRSDGYYLRQDLIWHKPNPMPESVTDRCTKAHEYIFLMSKSERYYYDAEAIKEDSIWKDPRVLYGSKGAWELDGRLPEKRNGGKLRKPAQKGSFNGKTEEMAETGQNAFRAIVEKRNKRSVWTVSTAPFPGSHFATFPPKLIEPCILAGCPSGGTVIDPFGGSGTVGMVAEENGRNSILIELNPKYVEMAKRRTSQQGLFGRTQEGRNK